MTAAIALALIGLTPGLASAAAPKNAPAPVTACQKISCATALPLNKTVKGGGHNIDFWKVTLVGGYRVSFAFTAGSSGGGHGFDLYAPSTKDGTFYQTGALVTQLGPGSGSDFTLQAPYTGTFILAVCQAASGYNVPGN